MAREVPENGSLLGDRNAPNILMQQKLRRRPKWAPFFFLTAQFYLEYLIGSISSFHTEPSHPADAAEWHHYCGIFGATENGYDLVQHRIDVGHLQIRPLQHLPRCVFAATG